MQRLYKCSRTIGETVSRHKRILRFLMTMAVVLALLGLEVKESSAPNLLGTQPAIAQLVRPGDVWQQVYQQLPNLPLENQYSSKETGKVARDNTLISRLIKYHIYVKGRPPNYRLDWKLTLADYLGANEIMEEGIYPGNDSLRANPIDGDRTAIGHLNRAQRDALVEVLVSIFNQTSATLDPTPDALSHPSSERHPSSTAAPQPHPGDAKLLMP